MRFALVLFITIVALAGTAFAAQRIVFYEHFTAVW